ncbi:hypothetical protein EUA93_14855 [Nocardioides oleivorans]|uniref:Glycosyltransferase RgtA/B/C/D-like domain-containing protein n=1 Tax=Nocardioides oleivorans TaxID=273676 RepID=A0A4Q2S1X7_9ACTN|nr:hypothetical protein [Nocardioides oleivorans]RYB95508.1 hypothetical protein EUA93_14855 [Nocardioides oleivorans]
MTSLLTGARQWAWSASACVAGVALLAAFVSIGGDWDWLVAFGDIIRRTGAVPESVPYAAVDTSGWHNVPVLAELVASLLHSAGARVPVLAHLVAVAVALATLAAAARARGASDPVVAGAVGSLVMGSLATLGIVRAQTLSLVPFALLLALVVRQHRRPDRGIWWAVPLVAVWGNLHGAALLGTCVLGAYLVVDRLRLRPAETVAVGIASLAALCATPQGWHTPRYYAQVFDNVAAERAEGLWARPSLSAPFDVLMLVVAALLLVLFVRARRPLWEYVAVAGLCLATASAARHGVWLLFLLVALAPAPRDPSDRAERPDGSDQRPAPTRVGMVLAVAASLAVALPLAASRGSSVLVAGPDVVDRVADLARSSGDDVVVLAPVPLSESLAVAGVRLWASNPLDAFSHADQAAYLDFLGGQDGMLRAVEQSDLVVTREGTRAEDVVAGIDGLQVVECPDGWTCRIRTP